MPEDRLKLDFETYSELNLKEVGAFAYAEHPSTEILCLSWKFKNTGKRGCWIPGTEFPVPVIHHVTNKGLCEAHNVPFEFNIWKNKLYRADRVITFGTEYPLPPIPMPVRWLCSLSVCAYRALPLGLDKVGGVLQLDVQKDKRGKYLIQKLCGPRKPTKKDPSTRLCDFGLLEEMYDYCDRDVDAEEMLGKTLGDLPGSEYKVWLLDQTINNRGVQVDTEAVHAAIYIRDIIFEKMEAELIGITGGAVETGKQVAKMGDWLEAAGHPVPNLQKDTVTEGVSHLEALLKKHPDNDSVNDCLRVLQIRQVLGNASSAKLDKFRLTTSRDGRNRGIQQYHGGGTGRWAGRGIQPHNFPRGTAKNVSYKDKNGKEQWALDVDLLIEHIKMRDPGILELIYGNPLEAISTALRSMLIAAPGKILRVADFSAIEARGTMWLAGQTDGIEAFKKYDKGIGPDIYCHMAEQLYERPIDKVEDNAERQLGKVTILGCGYQMGPPRLQEQAKKDYGIDLTLEQAEWLVGTYREKNDMVPALWAGLQDAAFAALQSGRRHDFRKIGYDIVNDAAGKWLICILPNGRKLWYFNPKIIKTITSWGAEKWAVSYEGRDNKRGGSWQRVTTYGGMLTENVVQAVSRDIMVDAMFRVEKAGYPIILTVHDEVIAETDEDFGSDEEFEQLLVGPIAKWAYGFPISAEGWSGQRYKKG